jgi:hypothetical protein
MNIQLVKGGFNVNEAIDLMSQLVQVKIKFHETRIHASHSEEDIKMRENRIKQLQNDLAAARNYLKTRNDSIIMDCPLLID